MFRSTNAGMGLLILRIAVGFVFAMHGFGKLLGPPFVGQGMDATAGFFGQLGIPLPTVAAWGVALAESLGGIAIMLGALVPLVALVLSVDMAVAILLLMARLGKSPIGGVELELVLLAGSLCLFFAGPGLMSVRVQNKGS